MMLLLLVLMGGEDNVISILKKTHTNTKEEINFEPHLREVKVNSMSYQNKKTWEGERRRSKGVVIIYL